MVLSLLVAAAVAGCGAAPGDVSGKVTYKGKALPGGYVTFLSQDGKMLSSPIQADGSYSVPAVPAGLAKITVQGIARASMRPMPMPKGATMQTPAKTATVYVPPQYSDAGKSGLTYEVKSGPQTHDLPLQ